MRHALDGLADADAARRPTASALCLGGIVRHVAYAEEMWIDFVVSGEKVDDLDRYAESFRVGPGDTVAGLLEHYAATARRTDEVVAALPSLDVSHPLPDAPWYPDDSFTARQVLLHLIAETSRHAGHADILRETLDGRTSAG
ncbi:DinB family protein [Pseudonocardia broussonetiae]|uniref:DinB family protein n=1 Tax=Pseudonocardia broussonetiae TaxID=2736640 RepID=A0A6M6JW25_9PSEU|nr:DinB family protein [Pseudonocardia broussonetiae]